MVLIHFHVLPASLERYSPLSRRCGFLPRTESASTMTYTMFGLLRATWMFIRPFGVSGNPPPLISRQLEPPSVVFQSADPGPPLLRNAGLRTRAQLAAYSVLGSRGSITTSTNPALSLMNLLIVHVLPPSTVLYRPRSGFDAHCAPSAATYTMFGLVGCTTMRPICCVFSRPIDCHVVPPSTDLYTPNPGVTLFLEFCSPVPAQIVFGSLAASAMSPIDAMGAWSHSGTQVVPAFEVFQMPPAAPET